MQVFSLLLCSPILFVFSHRITHVAVQHGQERLGWTIEEALRYRSGGLGSGGVTFSRPPPQVGAERFVGSLHPLDDTLYRMGTGIWRNIGFALLVLSLIFFSLCIQISTRRLASARG